MRLTAALADRYRIERELGAGGMATVYLAEDLKHHRQVAVKVLKPELAAVLGAERFVQEIATTAALQHPHILPLFDSGTANGFLYYVMPYVEGETLRAKLDRETQLAIDEAVRITTEVAEALDYAHRHGVIHRDIKPENILLHDGRPVVADFGIALAVSAAAGGRMTETGLSLGTPHYMSPEQATAAKEITARSDVYSLASVLYEMLAGEPPHSGGSAQQIIMKIVTEDVAPVTTLRKSVPPHVEAALMTALEKLPADRFASAREFAEALRDESRRLRRYAGALSRPAATRRLTWILTATAVGMIVVVLLLMGRPSSAPAKPMQFVLARTTYATEGRSLSISRDGRLVVYLATKDGVTRVYRRFLAELDAEALPGTEGAVEAVVSPDGGSVAVMGGDAQLSITPVDGGRSHAVVRTAEPSGMSWSARHGLVLGMPGYSTEIWGLTRVKEAGDTALTVLTRPRPGAMDHFPRVLDDGETVVYIEYPMHPSGLGTPQLGIGTISGNDWRATNLTADGVVGVADGILVYLNGGAMMAVHFDRRTHRPVGDPVRIARVPDGVKEADLATDGTLVMRTQSGRYQVALVNERGEGPSLLPDTVTYLIPRFSPEGRRAAFILPIRGRDRGVWTLSLADRALARLGFEQAGGLDWTPDGRRVAADVFGATIWQAADASDSTAYLQRFAGRPLYGLALAPDGNTLVVVTGWRESGFDLLMRRTNGDTTTVPLVATRANEYAPRFSPDGRWLSYTSDETGRPEVYVQPFPGPGQRIQVSKEGGGQSAWSGDSHRIYFRTGGAFMVADLSVPPSGGSPVVMARRKLFEGEYYGSAATELTATYDVSADGRTFLVGRALREGEGEIVVWTGWLEELKAQLAQVRP